MKKRVIMTLAIVFLVGSGFHLLTSLEKIEITREFGNQGQYIDDLAVGNCVTMRERNSLSSFPHIFGSRLYLYDIDNDKQSLLASTYIPFSEISHDVIVTKDAIYYHVPIWNEVIGDYYRRTDWKTQKIDIDTLYYGYSIYKNNIYYENVDNSSGEYLEAGSDLCTDIYVKNLDTGEEKKFLEGNFDYFRVKEDKMYCHDLKKKEILLVDVNNGKLLERYPYDGEYISFIEFGENDKFYINEWKDIPEETPMGGIAEYDTNKKCTTWSMECTGIEHNSRLHYKDGYLYYSSEFEIIRINVNNHKPEKLINLEPYMNPEEERGFITPSTVSYCDDYIVVDLSYFAEGEGYGDLLIYDYEGNYIRKE